MPAVNTWHIKEQLCLYISEDESFSGLGYYVHFSSLLLMMVNICDTNVGKI